MQGFLAPVAASVSLFGIYLLLKYFPDLSLQTFIDGYFFLLGSSTVPSLIAVHARWRQLWRYPLEAGSQFSRSDSVATGNES